MVSTETAAGRLHRVLMALRACNNMRLGEAWVHVLDLEQNVEQRDNAELLRRLAIVLGLPALIEKSVRDLPDVNQELPMRWQPKVTAAFAVAHRFEESASVLVAQYDDAVLLSLEVADDLVSRGAPTYQLSSDAREAALDLVSELLDVLETLDAPDGVKALLIRHALRLQDALRLYPLTGAQGVAEALYDASCALATVAPDGATDTRPPMAKFANTLAFLADALQIVSAVVSIVPPVSGWIGQIGQ